MRRCKTCGQVKPLEAFVIDKKAPTGRRHLCIICRRNHRKTKRCPICDSGMSERAKLCSRCNGLRKRRGTINKGGYRVITVGDGEAILEHRHIMELHLGRGLYQDENVHHINGDKLDNRVENLELWSTSQPPGQRVEDKLAWAHEIIERYSTGKSWKDLS